MLNKVQLIGRMGQDPELRHVQNGEAVCNFSLATSEKYNDKSGEPQEQTEWHRVSAWGRHAEIIGEFLQKGSLVYVEGKLQSRKYTDKNGTEKISVEIRLFDLKMLGGRQEQGDQPQQAAPASRAAPAARQPVAAKPAPPPRSGFDDMDDDIPF